MAIQVNMIQRLKNSLMVFLGLKEAISKSKPETKNISFEKKNLSPDAKIFIGKTSLEFIFAEFGENRVNAGGNEFTTENRLNPTLDTLRHYFPHAKYTVYSDFDLKIEGVETILVEIPVPDIENPRTGHRSSVYYRFKGLLNSTADFKCSIDSDMKIVSGDIISLLHLTEKFGFCVPFNTRQLLRQDMKMSLDTNEINDLSLGMGRSYNQTPMTLWKDNLNGTQYYLKCAELMAENPARGSLIMWKAAWETGLYPYVLPKQFCVCEDDIGCGDEVILHIGHPKVAEYYSV